MITGIGLVCIMFTWQAACGSHSAVLDTNSAWRAYVCLSPPLIGSGKSARTFSGKSDVGPTEPPPKGWTSPDFDDSGWCPSAVPFWGEYGYGQPRNASLLCLRGLFRVDDPSAATEVKVSVKFRGGVVVYVNGAEIGRAHIPEGEISAETPAEEYPLDAYTTGPARSAEMPSLNGGDSTAKRGASLLSATTYPAESMADRYSLRIRTLNVPVKTGLLRKGMNVLAVEVHRAPAIDVKAMDLKDPGGRGEWNHLGVLEANLSAGAGLARWGGEPGPGRIDVVAVNSLVPVEPGLRLDGSGKPASLELVAPRGGAASGQIVVRPRGAARDLRVTVGGLRLTGGSGTIERQSLRMRYAWLRSPSEEGFTQHFPDVLCDMPDLQASVQPVWLTVDVPTSSAAGVYEGSLQVSAGDAGETTVPVRLTVCPWSLPPAEDRGFALEIFQSPETLAAKYNVPLWSDKHFALVEESMRLLAALGNRVAVIPLSGLTYLGNSQTMVRWVKRDGKLSPDFALAERYLDLFAKYHGQPRFICLDVWHADMGCIAGSIGSVNDPSKVRPASIDHVPVSLIDPDTGQSTITQAPSYADPQAETFWRPATDGMRALIARKGWSEKLLALGYAGDRRPDPTQVALFRKLLPEAGWMLRTHTPTPDVIGGPVVFASTPFSPRGMDYPETVFPRDYRAGLSSRPALSNSAPPAVFCNVPSRALIEGWDGVGGVGADFWPVPTDEGARSIVPNMGHLGLRYTLTCLLAPGPEGPLATVRYEAFREGLQEAEAQWRVVKALTDQTQRARLNADLVARCQKLMRDRRDAVIASAHVGSRYPWPGRLKRAEQLFRIAGEVAGAVQAKEAGK